MMKHKCFLDEKTKNMTDHNKIKNEEKYYL